MEITPTHIAVLNSRLPAGFKIEVISTAEPVQHQPVTKRRSEAENLHFDMRFHASSTRTQRVVSRPELEALPAKLRNSEGFVRAYNVIQKLKQNENIGTFLKPVDAALYPDYYEIIQEPVNLGEIETKLLAGEYETMRQFAEAVRKMWNNSFLYNSRGSDLYLVTVDLSACFETLIRDCEHLAIGEKPRSVNELSKKLEKMEKELRDLRPRAVPMTLEEKRVLAANIGKLPHKYLKGVIEIVRDNLSGSTAGSELEFNLDELPVEVTRKLEAYVAQSLSETKPVEPQQNEVVEVKGLEKPEESESSSSSSDDSEEEAVEVGDKGTADYWSAYNTSFYPQADPRTN